MNMVRNIFSVTDVESLAEQLSCCFKFQNENCFSSTFDGVYISCHLF